MAGLHPYQFHDVLVEHCQTMVQRCQAASVLAGQGGQIGVGDLPVTQYATPVDFLVCDAVRPKVMRRVRQKSTQNFNRFSGIAGNSLAHQMAHQGALSDRAGGKGRFFSLHEPPRDGSMMYMIRIAQRDQDIAVQQHGHASSSRVRTSSLVIGRPERNVGKPVTELIS